MLWKRINLALVGLGCLGIPTPFCVCKKGEEVKIKSPTGNKEFDGKVVSQAEDGYYRVFVEARNKVARVSEANLARSLSLAKQPKAKNAFWS